MKPSPSKNRHSRPAYPPHVVGTAASEMNDVFEGLDASAWDVFVHNLEEHIEARIYTWRPPAPRMVAVMLHASSFPFVETACNQNLM